MKHNSSIRGQTCAAPACGKFALVFSSLVKKSSFFDQIILQEVNSHHRPTSSEATGSDGRPSRPDAGLGTVVLLFFHRLKCFRLFQAAQARRRRSGPAASDIVSIRAEMDDLPGSFQLASVCFVRP